MNLEFMLNTVISAPRRSLKKMINIFYRLYLPTRLFSSNIKFDISPLVDFEMENYKYFLDHVSSLEDLILGLSLLSPFADDALGVAESLSYNDFVTFKLALPTERLASQGATTSCMPQIFASILLPNNFIYPLIISAKSGTSLGVTILRCMEVDAKIV